MDDRTRTKVLLALCALPGIFLIVSGLLLIFARSAADVLFDLQGAHSIANNPLATGLGIRQLAIGLMIVALALGRQIKALGTVLVIGALVPAVDFLSFYPTIGVVSAMRHGATVPFILGLGLYLLNSKQRS